MQNQEPRERRTRQQAQAIRRTAATPNVTRERTGYTPAVQPKNKKKRASVILLIVVFAAALALMYAIFPKEPGRRTDSSAYSGLVISEVMAANKSAVPDDQGNFPDWVELYNGTGADLEMEGVMFTNRTDRIRFVFPAYTLKAGESVIIFGGDYYQMDSGEEFHGKFKISSAGDHLYLYDPDMYLVDELGTPSLTSDEVYALTTVEDNTGSYSYSKLEKIPEGATRHYETSSYYSPGFANGESGFVDYRADSAIMSGDLVINEICPDPKIGIPDEDGEIVDWVELKNNTDHDISLTGYYLSDKENKPMKWQFPDGAVIPANGYYLIYCSGKDKLQSNGVPHTNFSLSAERETVVLSDSSARLVDRISIENIPEDCSWGRSDAGDLRQFQLTSPGQPNTEAGQNKSDNIYQAYNSTGVYISEVCASNSTISLGAAQETCDYLELYNSSSNIVYLSGYGLSDNIKRPRKWQFPEGAVIYPNSYLIIYLDGDTSKTTTTEFHTNFKLSRSGGETVCFCTPEGRILDRLPLTSTLPTDISYGRTLGMNGFFYYDSPTPGTANGAGFYGYAATPAFSLPGGEYKGSPFEITISVPENTTVYYTDNGDIPTNQESEHCFRYNGEPITVSGVMVLRARAFDGSGLLRASETATESYLCNLYHSFPIVSIVCDTDELWNAETGMLTVGENVDKSNGIPFKNTVYRTWGKVARPMHVEFYLKDGTTMIDQDAQFALQGQYSLDMPQKSFKIKAKAQYGNKYFEGKLFDNLDYTQYKGFVLRMSGNDCVWTRFNDVFQSQLIKQFNAQAETPSTVIYQEWQPVVVYLNGTYWGHYNMRERVDRYFVAQHEGLSLEEADDMDIVESSGKATYGSASEYKAMIKRIKSSSPGTNEEDLQYILDNVDVDNYFDYMAFEMFFGNSDPGNIRYYRLHKEGSKWRWIFYDADYGLFRSGYDSPTSYLKAAGAGDQKIDNTIIRKLLENDAMRDKFLRRLGEIYQYFTTETMTTLFNSIAATLEPEMTMHFYRWAEENDKAINVDSPTTPEGAMRYWNTRLDYTRNVLKKRPTYFYEMVQEEFELTDKQMLEYFGEKPALPDDAVVTKGKKWG